MSERTITTLDIKNEKKLLKNVSSSRVFIARTQNFKQSVKNILLLMDCHLKVNHDV